VHATFSQVIQPFLREGTDTTSSTAVVAVKGGAFRTIVVASATGMVLHERVAVDVDDALELATIRSISGTSIGVTLEKAHAGTYPVSVDSGLVQVRECLAGIITVRERISRMNGTGALKKVDEVEFYDTKSSKSRLGLLQELLEWWRDELRSRLGIPRQSPQCQGGSSVVLM
jgi:hypothetical protein